MPLYFYYRYVFQHEYFWYKNYSQIFLSQMRLLHFNSLKGCFILILLTVAYPI